MYTNWFYNVRVWEYAKKHFIKWFKKKYTESIWNETFSTIEDMLRRIDLFVTTSKVEKIHCSNFWYIAKCEFKIVGSNESPKTSWNRIIIYVNQEQQAVLILLVYSKTDIWSYNETSWWQKEIKNNYPEISKLFSWL